MVHLSQLLNLHWHVIISPSVVYLRVTFGGFDKCIMTSIHPSWEHHAEIFTALKKPLCSAPSSLPLQPLETTDHLTVSIVLCVLECIITGIIHYVELSDGLRPFSNMHLSLLRVFSWPDVSFLLSTEEQSIFRTHHSLFVHSLIERYLGGFQVLAIVNKAGICIHVQVFVGTEAFYSCG